MVYRVIQARCALSYYPIPLLTLNTKWYVICLVRNSSLTWCKLNFLLWNDLQNILANWIYNSAFSHLLLRIIWITMESNKIISKKTFSIRKKYSTVKFPNSAYNCRFNHVFCIFRISVPFWSLFFLYRLCVSPCVCVWASKRILYFAYLFMLSSIFKLNSFERKSISSARNFYFTQSLRIVL